LGNNLKYLSIIYSLVCLKLKRVYHSTDSMEMEKAIIGIGKDITFKLMYRNLELVFFK